MILNVDAYYRAKTDYYAVDEHWLVDHHNRNENFRKWLVVNYGILLTLTEILQAEILDPVKYTFFLLKYS